MNPSAGGGGTSAPVTGLSAGIQGTSAPDHVYDAYIFDLDGTVYLGEGLLPGARDAIEELRARDRAVRFVSNNPTRDREQYARKLTRLGIPTSAEDVVTTVVTMTRWLLDNAPHAAVFPIAEAPLVRSLQEAGIRISEDQAEIDFVIASYDRAFCYRKLQIAFDAIRVQGRARLIATNPDPFCPLDGGRGEPDAGAVIAAVQACTGARLEACTGKPDPIMLRAVLRGLDVEPSRCVMVGDRLSTDIRMALDAGMPSLLVLTGETRREDLAGLKPEDRPTRVLETLEQLLPR